MLWALSQKTKAVKGWLPKGCIAAVIVDISDAVLDSDNMENFILTKDQSKEQRLPTRQVSQNDLGSVWFAFRGSSGF